MKHQLTSRLNEMHLRVPKLLTDFHVPDVSYAIYEKCDVSPFSAGLLRTDKHQKVDEASLFYACSMSKLVTSLMVLKLVEQGVLDLDMPINGYLKGWRLTLHQSLITSDIDSGIQEVTLIHLLNHSSGILDHEAAFGPLERDDSVPNITGILSEVTPLSFTAY